MRSADFGMAKAEELFLYALSRGLRLRNTVMHCRPESRIGIEQRSVADQADHWAIGGG